MDISTPLTTSNESSEISDMTVGISHLTILYPSKKGVDSQKPSVDPVGNTSSPTRQNATQQDDETTGTSRTFTCFSRLPTELRLAIFGLVARPRKIRIWVHESDKQLMVLEAQPYTPILLHVNYESRLLTQERYRVGFEAGARRPIYYDPKRDVITSRDTHTLQRFRAMAMMHCVRSSIKSHRTDFDTFALRINKDYLHDSEENYNLGVTLGGPYTGMDIKMARGARHILSAFTLTGPLVGNTMIFVHVDHWDEAFSRKTAEDFYEHLKTKDPDYFSRLSNPRTPWEGLQWLISQESFT